jgi:prepilin-type N-terminal cleavage/methylation domain-containing protein
MGGFTLLEIMVSMLLLTIIVTSSVSLLFLNIKGWDALTADSEIELEQMLINDRIYSIIGNLTPLVWQTSEGKSLAFGGEGKRLHFVSKAPQQYRGGGLFEYLLREEIDNEGRAMLVLYYVPYLPDAKAFRLPEDGSRRVLLSDLEGIGFSYYGLEREGGQSQWLNQWENDLNRLPEFIALNLNNGNDSLSVDKRVIPLMTSKVWER